MIANLVCQNDDCNRSGPNAHVEHVSHRTDSPLMCRWCRSARTRLRKQAIHERLRSAVAQPVEQQAVNLKVAGSKPARGATESEIKPAMWMVAAILLFMALAFVSCKVRITRAAEAPVPTCWEYVTETGTAWTDTEAYIPERYRPTARERECGSIFDYERTTIINRSDQPRK